MLRNRGSETVAHKRNKNYLGRLRDLHKPEAPDNSGRFHDQTGGGETCYASRHQQDSRGAFQKGKFRIDCRTAVYRECVFRSTADVRNHRKHHVRPVGTLGHWKF